MEFKGISGFERLSFREMRALALGFSVVMKNDAPNVPIVEAFAYTDILSVESELIDCADVQLQETDLKSNTIEFEGNESFKDTGFLVIRVLTGIAYEALHKEIIAIVNLFVVYMGLNIAAFIVTTITNESCDPITVANDNNYVEYCDTLWYQ